MYTLRIIEETREDVKDPFDQVIENFDLGTSYSIIRKGATREFDAILKNQFPEVDTEGITALVCGHSLDESRNTMFVYSKDNDYRKFTYYIMTDGGKTFEKL